MKYSILLLILALISPSFAGGVQSDHSIDTVVKEENQKTFGPSEIRFSRRWY